MLYLAVPTNSEAYPDGLVDFNEVLQTPCRLFY